MDWNTKLSFIKLEHNFNYLNTYILFEKLHKKENEYIISHRSGCHLQTSQHLQRHESKVHYSKFKETKMHGYAKNQNLGTKNYQSTTPNQTSSLSTSKQKIIKVQTLIKLSLFQLRNKQ